MYQCTNNPRIIEAREARTNLSFLYWLCEGLTWLSLLGQILVLVQVESPLSIKAAPPQLQSMPRWMAISPSWQTIIGMRDDPSSMPRSAPHILQPSSLSEELQDFMTNLVLYMLIALKLEARSFLEQCCSEIIIET